MSTSNNLTDNDGDSQMMADNHSYSIPDDIRPPTTPPHQRLLPSDLSPPDSQGGVPIHSASPPTMPTAAPSASGANANGKRPLDTLDMPVSNSSAILSAKENENPNMASSSSTTRVNAATGYSWSRPEDAPGYTWSNRKSQEEANRAYEHGVVDKNRTVQTRYGDPFLTAELELSTIMKNATSVPIPDPAPAMSAAAPASRIEQR